ncbi:uncharacterized protein LOC123865089 [Maniola jurtina]|uniref:uncharacterized protein LOC123865089 n=1 Tax=Maniola jurtina TaxID=191418 RepID=UPI001E68B366|nr:uncharacterized protein LOC123865089 [Maniola jurtina]
MIRTFIAKRILYFLIFFHSNQIISSYTVIDVYGLPEPKLVQDFVNDYQFKDDNVADYSKRPRFRDDNEIINRNGEKGLWNAFKKGVLKSYNYRNKLLVKRIVPHGMVPSGIEYDHKFNTAFKPLVRVHKTKTINQFFNDLKSKKYDGYENKDTKHENIIFMSPKDVKHKKFKVQNDLNDKDLIEPFETSKNDFDYKDKRLQKKIKDIRFAHLENKNNLDLKDKRLQLVKKIQKKIKGIKSESKRLSAYAKVINVLNNMLRSPQFVKSGEEHDTLAPDTEPKQDDMKTKKWIPHYPPWNYWTYKKTIHEDVCPGAQVKIGNMCIWVPPH